MSNVTPTPKSFTLRCKILTTTILLYADATTSLGEIKDELLVALQDAYPNGGIPNITGAVIPLPDSAHDIILGKLIDAGNTRGGWERLEAEQDDAEEMTTSKGKGKAPVGGRLSNGISKVTVSSVGLVDGSLLAVKFRSMEPEEPDDDDVTLQERWDVVLPQRDIDEGFEEGDDHGEIQLPARARTIT